MKIRSRFTVALAGGVEAEMEAAGTPVEVSFEGQGVDDEDYKTQMALDLGSGEGPGDGVLVKATIQEGNEPQPGDKVSVAPAIRRVLLYDRESGALIS